MLMVPYELWSESDACMFRPVDICVDILYVMTTS